MIFPFVPLTGGEVDDSYMSGTPAGVLSSAGIY
jgi:hypothetical protein